MGTSQNRAALLVPTYRKTPQIMANLAYLAALSSPNLHVWISDCSADREKKNYLNRLKSQHPFVKLLFHKQRVPLYRDVAASLALMQSYNYLSICADDDHVSLPYLEGSIEVLESDSSCVCSFGNYLLWLNGSVYFQAVNATDSSPVIRLQQAFDANAFNRLFFTVFRRSAMQPWINFCTGHPLIGAFFDALHHCSLLAQGTVRHQISGFYLWTGENWDTDEKNHEARKRYYADVGLDPEFANFHDLHFGVEGINFFVGEHCPISHLGTRLACAQTIWSSCMASFKEQVLRVEPGYSEALAVSPLAVDALHFLLQKENCDDRQILDAFEAILAVFSAPLAKTYGAHFRRSLARAIVT